MLLTVIIMKKRGWILYPFSIFHAKITFGFVRGLGTFLGFTVFQGILVGPNAVNLSPMNLMWMPLASFRRRPGSSLFNMLAGVGPRQGIDIVNKSI